MMATAGGGREACGMCGNRCHGNLCDRCQRQLQDADRALAAQLRREQLGTAHAPR